MYLDFYHLQHDPFPRTPDPAGLFRSPSHQRAFAAITSGVAERQGFVLITGASGVGKTTILQAYLAQVQPAQLTTIVIADTQVAFPALLTTLCQACGLEVMASDLFAQQTLFQQFLLAEYRHGRNIAIFIDEAQRLPLATLEQLWRLANLDMAIDKVVQIVLLGQPDLEQRLHQYALRHIAQRLAVRATIVPLTSTESRAYIRQHLARVAPPGHRVFTRGALRYLLRAAHGIPQRLNCLCTHALVRGCGVRQHPITARLARAVVAECAGATPTPRWRLGLAAAAGLLLVTGGLWLTLHGARVRVAGPGSPQPWAPAAPPARRPVQEPHAESPSFGPSRDGPTVPSGGPSTLPAPRPSSAPASVPPSLPTGEGAPPGPTAAPPVDEPHPAPGAGALEPQAVSPPREAPTSVRLPRRVIIKRGDSVWKLALETYGFVDASLLQRIHAQNPHLKNLDVLPIDATLMLPGLEPPGATGQ